MALTRAWVKRVERAASEGLGSFELLDGTYYFYNHLEACQELFMHAHDVLLGDEAKWPEPPEIYQKMCEARDVAAVLERFRPEDPERAFVDVAQIYDTDILINERRLVLLSHPSAVEDLSAQESD
jgi:hypothetical protein